MRSLSTARLRLDSRVLRQAEAQARLAGVSVTELIELLLQGLIDCEEGHRPQTCRPPAPAAALAPAPRIARVLDLDGFRRRRAAPGGSAARGSQARPPNVMRAHASSLCRRAAEVRARGEAARAAAARARAQAQLVLAQLLSVVTPAS